MVGKKIDAFAGLRGYAIILVFLSHYSFGVNSKGLNITNWLGALGVEVFIILSGFLLMENHSNTTMEFKPYFIRKVIKFYPLHFITLLMAVPFGVKARLALLSQIMLVQAWFPDPDIYFSLNGVAWYLSITIFFIAVSPLTVKMWNKLTMRSSAAVMAGIITAEIILCTAFGKSAFAHWILYVAPFVRILDFFMGGGCWKLVHTCHNHKVSKHICTLSILLLAVLCILSFFQGQDNEWFSVVVWIMPVTLLIYSIGAAEKENIALKIFSNKGMVFIGSISFEIFLIHQLVIRYVERLFHIHGILGMFVDILFTLLGVTMWKIFANKIVFQKRI